jgi:hypothetical protein
MGDRTESVPALTEVQAARCWPWSHKWTMWIPYVSRAGSLHQQRCCLLCGIAQDRYMNPSGSPQFVGRSALQAHRERGGA